MTSTYWSFRITLADRPGGLAEVARAVADLGVNILDLEVHLVDATPSGATPAGPDEPDAREPGAVADDIVVELPYWMEPCLIELCLLRAGAVAVAGRRIDPHDLVDSQTRLVEIASQLVRDGATDDAVAASLRRLLVCDLVWFGPPDGLATAEVVARARASRSPAVDREWLQRLDGRDSGPPWVAAIPWGPDGTMVAALVRTHLPFTATEVARAQAVLSLAVAVRAAGVRAAA